MTAPTKTAPPVDLSKLEVRSADLPTVRRGRSADPIPESIVTAVRDTFTMPEGKGGSFRVPNGELSEKGNDAAVSYVTGQLRRAATSLGYGLSVKVMPRGKATTEVLFKAKKKTARVIPAPDAIYVAETDDGTLTDVADDEGTLLTADDDGARLATADEAKGLGYRYTKARGWHYPESDEAEAESEDNDSE